MKRFYVFAGDDNYYKSGGWNDLHGSFDTYLEAKAYLQGYLRAQCCGWGHVVDSFCSPPKIVAEWRSTDLVSTQ